MSAEVIDTRKHSLEHVMVLAVKRLYAENILLGVGPVIENGFYQDFDYKFTEADFQKIESEMKKIISEDLQFKKELIPIDEAIEYFRQLGQKYKVELLEDIKSRGTSKMNNKEEDETTKNLLKENMVSIYQIGIHRDLCRGPHVQSSMELKDMGFKLDRLAGAYWRGNEKNKMLSRIYATAFASPDELTTYYLKLEEAKKRDHKKLGIDLGIFMFHDTSPGIPYWLPNGTAMLNELIGFWRKEHKKRGYQEIGSPLINKSDLYVTSGHWEYYKKDIFIADMGENEVYALKPMNCPNAMLVFKSQLRSYKDLPLRLSDTDRLHRYELSGTLNGLLRVRSLLQDDSHNFITEDMIESEYNDIFAIAKKFYSIFGLKYKYRLGTRPEKFMGDLKTWDKAEAILKDILAKNGEEYFILEGDGAFYGPKVDIVMEDVLGREWQMGTIQLDFQLPERFDLEYVDKDGQRKRPIVVHRVIYGSLERFIGIIIEHFAGAFPTWISPQQIKVIPISEQQFSYAKSIVDQLVEAGEEIGVDLRVSADYKADTLQAKIRNAAELKIPYILICGKREEAENKVAIRVRGKGDIGAISLAEFTSKILAEIKTKQINPGFD